jgi:acetyltransferase-like isoleucine patch superfamily enzyme
LYPLVKEIANEEFENTGINSKNQLIFLRQFAVLPENTLLMKEITFINKQNNPHKINFGENCRIGKGAELMVFKTGGEIKVGNNTLINANCHIYSMFKITIGNRVLLSYNVSILDNNSHPIDPERRKLHWTDESVDKEVECAEIIIDDDVWIGANVTILKGVRIGKGSIIAANSVVTKSIGSMEIAGGNPAKKIKKITNDAK